MSHLNGLEFRHQFSWDTMHISFDCTTQQLCWMHSNLYFVV